MLDTRLASAGFSGDAKSDFLRIVDSHEVPAVAFAEIRLDLY